jgi:hypothetical protein
MHMHINSNYRNPEDFESVRRAPRRTLRSTLKQELLPHRRFIMNTLRIAFITALLSASSAYADAADWTATIGTGHVSNSHSTASLPNASAPTATGISSSAHWSAFIGTGHATEATQQPVANAASVGPVNVSAHWASKIGTGRAAESNARVVNPKI